MVAEEQENKGSRDVESSKNGDLKSRQSDRTKTERRNLGIILGTLCVLAAVLAVFVIVNGIQKRNKQQEPEVAEEYTSEESEEDRVWKEAETFQNEYRDFQVRANELLARESVSVNEIRELYTPQIEKLKSKGDVNRAETYVREEASALISKGHKKEALEELTNYDYSKCDLLIRYKAYKRIIDLATELNETETVAKYEDLLAKTIEEKNNTNWEDV